MAEPPADAAEDPGAAGSPQIQLNDIVLSSAVKEKPKYDGHKGQVVGLLTKHVKVKLLEGPVAGEMCKYEYHRVQVV